MGAFIAEEARAWKLPALKDVRAFGFMIGFELNPAPIEACDEFRTSGKVPSIWLVQKLMDAGLLTVAAGPGVIRWLAPMNTTEAEVREGLRILREVLAGACE
jgi:acetylornithine/succinyldiaminopimelate/putrescine aminotransferase